MRRREGGAMTSLGLVLMVTAFLSGAALAVFVMVAKNAAAAANAIAQNNKVG